MEKYKNQAIRFGGIVTSAENATSQKGNPYGRYTIEDYSGSYKMVLFGETYKNNLAYLQPNLYVYVTGTIQQRGTGMRWFHEKNDEEAEFEFAVQKVELLKDVQDAYMSSLSLAIPLENVTQELIDELVAQCESHKGKSRLRIQVHDTLHNNRIIFTSKSMQVHITPDFYKWLKIKEMDNVLTLHADMQ